MEGEEEMDEFDMFMAQSRQGGRDISRLCKSLPTSPCTTPRSASPVDPENDAQRAAAAAAEATTAAEVHAYQQREMGVLGDTSPIYEEQCSLLQPPEMVDQNGHHHHHHHHQNHQHHAPQQSPRVRGGRGGVEGGARPKLARMSSGPTTGDSLMPGGAQPTAALRRTQSARRPPSKRPEQVENYRQRAHANAWKKHSGNGSTDEDLENTPPSPPSQAQPSEASDCKIYRVRSFTTTSSGIVNRGDSIKVKNRRQRPASMRHRHRTPTESPDVNHNHRGSADVTGSVNSWRRYHMSGRDADRVPSRDNGSDAGSVRDGMGSGTPDSPYGSVPASAYPSFRSYTASPSPSPKSTRIRIEPPAGGDYDKDSTHKLIIEITPDPDPSPTENDALHACMGMDASFHDCPVENDEGHLLNGNLDDEEDDKDDEEDEEGAEAECPTYKVLVLGTHGVGKTTLAEQLLTSEYLANTDYRDEVRESEETIISVQLDDEESLVHLCDISNFEEAKRQEGVDAYVVVYSVTDRGSFSYAQACLQDLLRKKAPAKNKVVILVGNKNDLVRGRIVSESDGRQLASRRDIKFTEVSALLDHRVDELLVGIIRQIRLKERGVVGPPSRVPSRVGSRRSEAGAAGGVGPMTVVDVHEDEEGGHNMGCLQKAAFGLFRKLFRKNPKKEVSKSCDNLML